MLHQTHFGSQRLRNGSLTAGLALGGVSTSADAQHGRSGQTLLVLVGHLAAGRDDLLTKKAFVKVAHFFSSFSERFHKGRDSI